MCLSQSTGHSFAKCNKSRTHSHSGRGLICLVTGMGEALLCVLQLCLVLSFPGSLSSKESLKSRLPLLRMETVPTITESCEVNRRLAVEGMRAWGEEPEKGRLKEAFAKLRCRPWKTQRGAKRQIWPGV